MNQQALIEQIVAEVMRKLMPAAEAAPAGDSTEEQGAGRLSDRVITADVLADKANGQKLVQVCAKAIVTPSARDWLRRNRVELVRGTDGATGSRTDKSERIIIVHEPDGIVERLLGDAGRFGLPVCDRQPAGDAGSAARLVVEAVTGTAAQGVVVLSPQPEVVACLANRSERVRAAVVADAAGVARVKSGLNGNVFVIDPSGRSYFELRNLLKTIQ